MIWAWISVMTWKSPSVLTHLWKEFFNLPSLLFGQVRFQSSLNQIRKIKNSVFTYLEEAFVRERFPTLASVSIIKSACPLSKWGLSVSFPPNLLHRMLRSTLPITRTLSYVLAAPGEWQNVWLCPDKATSGKLSRCRLLARYESRLGMQKAADPSDSSADGIELQRHGLRSTPPLRSLQTGVRSEVTVSAFELPLEVCCQDVGFWLPLTNSASMLKYLQEYNK